MSRVATGYSNFAAHEAQGRSPLYVELASGVARHAEILGWLDGLPTGKRDYAGHRLGEVRPAVRRVALADPHGARLSWG